MDFQRAIDAKVDSLLHEVQKLKEERNTYASISKLPDENLLEIFMVLMACSPVEEWYQVDHVCRRWRSVAVGAPMLWTKPTTSLHRLTILMLERSKMAGLTIFLDYKTSIQTAAEIFNQVERIESLAIFDRDDDDEDDDEDEDDEDFPGDPVMLLALLKGLVHGAPSLQVLEIRSWHSSEILKLLHPSGRMQKLLLSSAVFDWDVLPLHNLAHLFFQDVSLSGPISIQHFINTLRQMPLLESLVLPFSENVLYPLSLSAPPEAQITLPFLRLLSLMNGHPDHIHYFLAHTELPRLRRLRVEIEDPQGYTSFINAYPRIIHVIASAVKNGDFGLFEGISMSSWAYRTFMLCDPYQSWDYIHAHEYPLESPCVFLRIPGGQELNRRNGQTRLYTQVQLDLLELCTANFSRILHLDIHDLSTAEFMRLFARPLFSSLQKITLHGDIANNIPTLTNVLTVPPHPVGESPTIPFPHLRSIGCTWPMHSRPRPTPSLELDSLCRCLMLRRKYGYPLHELDLQYWTVGSTQLALLKEAVANVNLVP